MEKPAKKARFSEKKFWKKLQKYTRKAGVQVVYGALLLYYALQDENVPAKAKAIITGALGYFVFPADILPDIVPLSGYTDDIGVILFALSQVIMHITPSIKLKAKTRLQEWFHTIDDQEVEIVDAQLTKPESLPKE
ncbi:YkvA family protein [Rapidithrix thailandica]|uniref:YkvA family protein n=1 Tax=Rapidithrix thailandica TaxID=413964 RepID=A0AAW9SE62_9BACT